MEAQEYDRMHQQEQSFWWYRGLHAVTCQRIQTALQQKKPKHAENIQLLDAGCGSGGLLHYLHKALELHKALKGQQTKPDIHYYGLEFNPQALSFCAQKNPQVALTQGNINQLPFAPESFHLITCNDVLYHQQVNPAQALQEILRVLKPGGQVLVHLPAYNWLYSAHDRHVHGRERYNRQQLKQLLQNNGFLVQRCAYWNSLLFPLMLLHRLGSGRRKQHSDVEHTAGWLNRALYGILASENTLQKHGLFLPFGGSVWAWATKPE